MKRKLTLILLLFLILWVWVYHKNIPIRTYLLTFTTPLKRYYIQHRDDAYNRIYHYFFQKEMLQKLYKENTQLKKNLLEQQQYHNEIKTLYNILPTLAHMPLESTILTQTISYASLNNRSKLILTKDKRLQQNKIYGLIQESVVGGIAFIKNNQLFGYLTSNEKCRFSVFVGESNITGIAIGEKEERMIVKFIPKWKEVHIGDSVRTSGLDNIFFANIPVGEVIDVQIEKSYKIAHIKTYNTVSHPNIFFLIQNASLHLAHNINLKKSDFLANCPKKVPLIIHTLETIVAQKEENNTTIVQHQSNKTDQNQEEFTPLLIEQTLEQRVEVSPPLVYEENQTLQSIEEHNLTTTPLKPKAKVSHIKKRKKQQNIKKEEATLDLF